MELFDDDLYVLTRRGVKVVNTFGVRRIVVGEMRRENVAPKLFLAALDHVVTAIALHSPAISMVVAYYSNSFRADGSIGNDRWLRFFRN